MKERLEKFLFDWLILPLWKIADGIVPKNPTYWGFSVHHIKSDQFIENQRAVFEALKRDKSIKKIIFTRNDFKDFAIFDAENYEILPLYSYKGLILFARCKVLFITHSIAMDYSKRIGKKLFCPIKPWLKRRVIVNLWHGIPLKRLLALANEEVRKRTDRSAFRRKERRYYAGLIASSDIDSYAMATMFYPIKHKNVWVTGLPKNDFLLQPSKKLPPNMNESLLKIAALKKDKKLILYAPTYRQTALDQSEGYYRFSENDLHQLHHFLEKNGAVLGLRMHYFRNDGAINEIEQMVDNVTIFDLGHAEFPEISMVIRSSDYVVTDYSSIYMDALYLNKPIFSFAYDLDNYQMYQDGLLYDMKIAFPGPVKRLFSEIIECLQDEINSPKQIASSRYQAVQKMFYQYIDVNNSYRVIEQVKNLL